MNVPVDMKPERTRTVGPEAERWLVRLQAADCSAEERAQFEAWRNADPAHARAFSAAQHYWQTAAQLQQDEDLRAIVEDSRARLKRRRAFWSRWGEWSPQLAAVATVLVVAVGLGIFGYRGGWFAPEPTTYATAVGERQTVPLEDGSTLILNTNTAVEVAYRRTARQLTLVRGEAQFDVHHNAARPFRVSAAGATVTALGTRFQVRTSAEATAVTLLEGKVRVDDPAEGNTAARSTELAPGERLLMPAGQPWERSTINPDIATGWTEGRLEFRAVPLPQAIAEINRYTPRKLRLADDTLRGIRLNGIFDAGDTESVLGALEYAYSVKVDRSSPEEIVLRTRQ